MGLITCPPAESDGMGGVKWGEMVPQIMAIGQQQPLGFNLLGFFKLQTAQNYFGEMNSVEM